MKKLILPFLLLSGNLGFSQFYQASVAEFTHPLPATNLASRAEHASAYSYSNLGGKDYYLYSWDGGSNLGTPTPGSGIAFLAYNTGTPVGNTFTGSSVNPLGFPANDAVSIEVLLLQNSTNPLVVATYYQPSLQRFMLNLFSLDRTTLNQESCYQIALSLAAPSSF